MKIGFRREHKRVQFSSDKPSKTKQEFKQDCDMNVIINRFTKTGVLPLQQRHAMYLNLVGAPNLQQSMHLMMAADAAFMTLPAKVRKEFDNNPMKFVEFATDEKNLDKLREWGLAPQPKQPEPPARVEVVNLPKGQADSEKQPPAK